MAFATIDKGSKYFNTVTYSGTGSNQAITVGFKPDFVWTKRRNAAYSNELQDAVRGTTKVNYSDNTNAEDTTSTNIQTFDTNGYTQGTGTGVNGSGGTYVSWNWLGANTTVSNTAGTITATVSANTTSGFSIVTYTGNGTGGATVGHGLGVAPKMVIVKNRTYAGTEWSVFHSGANTTGFGHLNLTNAWNTSSADFNSTAPSSTVVTLGSNARTNGSGYTCIAYCFAEVKGFSKAFSYTGNGSTDGSYVHLGFRPAWVMVKASSTTGQWAICDNRRGTANKANGEFLFAESSEALNAAVNNWDFLSNGLKARANYAAHNTSGVTYIGIAFAENPFVSSKGIPSCAV